jgi:predicted porin
VSDESSLLGVRGTEDLGGGLKAFFQLETSFKPDQNDSAFATRNSGVGLQGGWGSVLLGRWDTPLKATSDNVIDPFGNLTLGGITAAMSGSGVENQNDQFDRRDQNVIQYWTPNWGGFEARVSYSANETKTATTNPSRTSASATYGKGPWYVGYAWDEQNDIPFGAVVMRKMTGQAVFGSAVLGPVKLAVDVQDFKKDVASGFGYAKQKMWMGAVTYTLGNNQFIYVHQDAKDGGRTAATAVIQPKCKVDSLGYQYNFSRRTFALLQYTKVDNGDTGTCNFGSNQLTIAAGQDLTGLMFGLRHVF